MQHKLIALAVAGACSSLELAVAQGRADRRGELIFVDGGKDQPAPPKRRLTVDLKVEAEAIGDTPLGHLVVEALQEFIAANPTTMEGKFESKAGLDVSWTVRSEYFDADGRRVDCNGNELEQKTRGIVPDTGEQA